MRKLFTKIKNLIKFAQIVMADDSRDIRAAQIKYLGKQQRCTVFTPYGIMHNPPPNSAGPFWQIDGEESKLVGMFDLSNQRTLKNLQPGEIATGNYLTGDYVLFKDGKIIEVNATGDIVENVAGNITATVGGNITATIGGNLIAEVTGNIEATAGGNIVTEAGGAAEITAPTITITGETTLDGNVTITGNLTVQGLSALLGGIISEGSGATQKLVIEVPVEILNTLLTTDTATVPEANINGINHSTHRHGGVVSGAQVTNRPSAG